jgi:iron complex outermembrane receptor protein
MKPEKVAAFETGYRSALTEALSLDVAVFYNVYDDIRGGELGTPLLSRSPIPLHFVVDVGADNRTAANSYGIEAAVDVRAAAGWRIQTSYTFLQLRTRREGESNNPVNASAGEGEPHHQVSLRSSMDLRRDLQLDLWLRYVDRVPAYGVAGYTSLAARLAWKPRKGLELSVVGQNLLDRRHPEFGGFQYLVIRPTEVPRGLYGKMVWAF